MSRRRGFVATMAAERIAADERQPATTMADLRRQALPPDEERRQEDERQ